MPTAPKRSILVAKNGRLKFSRTQTQITAHTDSHIADTAEIHVHDCKRCKVIEPHGPYIYICKTIHLERVDQPVAKRYQGNSVD